MKPIGLPRLHKHIKLENIKMFLGSHEVRMLKILMVFILSLNFALASSRFSESEKQKFLDDVKESVSAIKEENKGKLDLQIIKPDLFLFLDSQVERKKISAEESENIKKHYDELLKKSGNTEESFNKFVLSEFDEMNKSILVKIKEGKNCNNLICEDGLQCERSPKQDDGPSCKKMDRECIQDKDCCSASCLLDRTKKKKLCAPVSLCFKPIALGQSCRDNPVCAVGICSAYNAKTLGINECSDNHLACKKNADCCSNSCSNNKCIESFVCKDCVEKGKKADAGKKCCEGLYPNEKNICVPDLPPTVLPQVRLNTFEKFLNQIGNIIFPSANAASTLESVEGISITKKSDYNTCDVHFKDDFYNYLKRENLLNLELALLSFDYVMLGNGVNDYWTSNRNDPNTSINGRLSSIAKNHQQQRHITNAQFDDVNHKLTCMCLDVIGYPNLKDEKKKAFFEKECPEFRVYQSGAVCSKQVTCSAEAKGTNSCTMPQSCNKGEAGCACDSEGTICSKQVTCGDTNSNLCTMPASCNAGDPGCSCTASTISSITNETASGIKGKRLLVEWTRKLQEFNASLAVNNHATYMKLAEIRDWAKNNADKWGSGERKETVLYHYRIKKLSWIAALIGTVVSAGTMGVYLGFNGTGSTTSSAFLAAITLISSGYSSIWAIDSLKGAWQDKPPYIRDVKTQSRSCGPRLFISLYKCEEHDVILNHPVNNVCQTSAYANACIKNFMAIYPGSSDQSGVPAYIIDPWVPAGVEKSLLIKNINPGKNYAESLEDSFALGKAYASRGGSKPGLDNDGYAQFGLRFSNPENFILTNAIINEIKIKAKQFAIDEKFFEANEEANLNAYANYAYEFHFLRPKLSGPSLLGYPLTGLNPYLEYMANGVAGSMAVGAARASNSFGTLNTQYLADYLQTLQLYKDQAVNQSDAISLKLLNDEINKTQAELDKQRVLNALAKNDELDSQLMTLNKGLVSSTAKAVGAKSDVILSTDQKAFLNAIGSLRSVRKTQLQNLEAYNRSIATSGNTDRSLKVASAAKSFATTFANPLSSLSASGKGALLSSNTVEESKAGDKNKLETAKHSLIDIQGAGSVFSSPARGASSPSTASSKTDTPKPQGNNVIDEDTRQLAAAIEARDKSNKSKYMPNDAQTIFEKVTNAYIRNYDKVLSKKKDKIEIEQNQ